MDEQLPRNSGPQEPVFLSPEPTLLDRHGISPVLFAFLCLIVIFILYQIVGGVITFLIFGDNPTRDDATGFRIATGLGQLFLLFLPTLLLVRLATSRPAEYLRIKRPNLQTLLVSLVGIVSLQQMLQVYLVFQDKIPLPEPIRKQIYEIKELIEGVYRQLVSSTSVAELLVVIVIIALIPAICEELFFRGLVQRSFERGLTPMRGMVVTGIIFAGFHLNPFTFVPLVALGIYLGFLVMRSGSLWVSVVAHFFNNLIACIALYFQWNDDYVFTGNANEMSTGGLLFTFWFFGVVFLLSTYYFLRITAPVHDTESIESHL